MNEDQMRKTLQAIAHVVVRNEILCEHFLQKLGIYRELIGRKAREIDDQLGEDKHWHNRFPGLFPED